MIRKSITISIALFLISLSILFLPVASWHKPVNYLPEQFGATNMIDTSKQQLAHQFWFLAIAVTCAGILFWPKSKI